MNNIELFFEEAKEGTLEEFKIIFDEFINKYENRNSIIDELIRYFNNYRKYLNEKKQSSTKEEYTKFEIKIIRCNEIINYLKYQYKHKNKMKIVDTNEKKSSNKMSNNESGKQFSMKVVELANKLLSEEAINSFLKDNSIDINAIAEVLIFLDYINKKTVRKKKEYIKKKYYNKVEELEKDIEKNRQTVKKIDEYINNLLLEEKKEIEKSDFLDMNKLNKYLSELSNIKKNQKIHTNQTNKTNLSINKEDEISPYIEKEILALLEENAITLLKKQATSLEYVDEIIKILNLNIEQLINDKRHLEKNCISEEISFIRNKIRKNKIIIKELRKYKNNLILKEKEKNIDNEKYQQPVVEDKTTVLSNIIKLYKDAKTKEFERYSILCNKKNELLSMANKDNNHNLLLLERNYLIEIKKVSQTINYLIQQENYYTSMLNGTLNKKSADITNRNIEYASNYELTEEQENIVSYLNSDIDIDFTEFDLKDVLYSFGYYIKKCKISSQVSLYGRELSYIFFDDEFECNEDIMRSLYYVLDCLRWRISNTDKESVFDRKILKELQREYGYILQIYQEENKNQKNNYFSLIQYLLSDENNITALNVIIDTIPNIVNTTYIKEDKSEEHIILYIVDEFIKNYKILIKNKNDSYINPYYLREVYFTFIRNYNIVLTEEEKDLVDKKLSCFMSFANQYITSPTRKLAIQMDLKSMYINNTYLYSSKKYDVIRDVDDYQLDNDLNLLNNNLKYSILDKNRVDLLEDNNITFNNSPYCYSTRRYYNNKRILKVSVIDIYSIINGNKNLENYLFNQTLSKEEVDSMITSITRMNEKDTYPTITYEITFDKNGNYKNRDNTFISFNIYQSKVKINKNYNSDDLIDRDDEIIRGLKGVYNKSKVRNKFNYQGTTIEVLDACFSNLVSEGLINFIRENYLPFIYSGYKKHNIINTMNNLDYLLPNGNEEYLSNIYEKLNNHENSYVYSSSPFKGIYSIPITNPISYQGLLIQEILYSMFIKCNNKNEHDYLNTYELLKNKIEEVIEEINIYNNYIEEDKLKEEKGKLKKYYISSRKNVV